MFDSNYRLHILVNTACLHEDVRYRLLNGQRRQVAVELGLSEQETQAIMAVQADTMLDFVRGLQEWTSQRQSSDTRKSANWGSGHQGEPGDAGEPIYGGW